MRVYFLFAEKATHEKSTLRDDFLTNLLQRRVVFFILFKYSLIAQLVEQVTVNHRAVGSSPTQGATSFLSRPKLNFARMALSPLPPKNNFNFYLLCPLSCKTIKKKLNAVNRFQVSFSQRGASQQG